MAALEGIFSECCPGSLELVDALFWVAEHHAQQLRTKELCETLESVTLIVADIKTLLSKENDPSGNRLAKVGGGMLLAYRFHPVIHQSRVSR